ncbi:MAG TPA: DEAD/DEAH box helicase family protein [Flavisolibacter sp.]|nr:DEAD/DEAH box helicase family protein [Flavisolibacter sp.]
MSKKSEAQARIKINQLLTDAGWRFFPDGKGNKANISCEYFTKYKTSFDKLGSDFEKTKRGFLDFLLLNDKGFPVALVEAKKESIEPDDAKDQARKYAESLGIRHIFLSNGNQHLYWDLLAGNPKPIRRFLTLPELGEAGKWEPDVKQLVETEVDENYIAYSQDHKWSSYTSKEKEVVRLNKNIKLLRDYQVDAVKKIQKEYKKGKNRFLFEMATGTGKTLLSAAIAKLFLSTGNADRILFLVDRLELETQAKDAFDAYFKEDNYKAAIYKENKSTWEGSQIVVTTIQSLSFKDRYKSEFVPSDFQLIISDEAHRTIAGNNKNIFEYFIGAKLGLTATPKNYLRGIDVDKLQETDPRQLETRMLKDTYSTFGCENSEPTFRFDLKAAVNHKPPYLVNPYTLDIRTDITVEMLSKEGWSTVVTGKEEDEEDDKSKEQEDEQKKKKFYKKDFEKTFFSEQTNIAFMTAFLKHAKRDPITGEIGKTIIFAVKRSHARKLVKILNDLADSIWAGKYNSDFAKQITSDIPDAQDMTKQFTTDKNTLGGTSRFNEEYEDYKTSKTRVAITVGMMTTGYDCEDLLNVVLCRPIFSPTDFVQIKGRGTRLATFRHPKAKKPVDKDNFYLFDFFANCEFFEKDFDYNKTIELPKPKNESGGDVEPRTVNDGGEHYYTGADNIKDVKAEQVGLDGMKVDREMFKPIDRSITDKLETLAEAQKLKGEDRVYDLATFFEKHILNKPAEYWTMEKISKEHNMKRLLDPVEYIEYLTGKRREFKSDDEFVQDFFERFYLTPKADTAKRYELQNLFTSYLLNKEIRGIMDDKEYSKLEVFGQLSLNDLETLGKDQIKSTLQYIKDNKIINKFQI